METESFVVYGPKSARETFAAIAEKEGFKTSTNRPAAFGRGIQNNVETLLLELQDSGIYIGGSYLVAQVIVAWLSAKSSRKLSITTTDKNGVLTTISAEGMSRGEIREHLDHHHCNQIMVYESIGPRQNSQDLSAMDEKPGVDVPAKGGKKSKQDPDGGKERKKA